MDQEMNFPNPVVRHDLPTRRRRWPKILVLGIVFATVGVLALPRVLSSKVGRKFVVSYIEKQTNSKVTLQTFQTSWRGPTTIKFLNCADADGRAIGFKSLTCKAGLLDLLRGKFRLGDNAEVDGLHVDWVVDNGRGRDTWDRLRPVPGAPLPTLSGNIKVKSGTVKLYRGTLQPGLYNTTWEQAQVENVQGELRIESLDKPWTFNLTAETVEGTNERGTIASSGTVALGPASTTALDVTLTAENVRTGQLFATLVPHCTPADARDALGPVLTRADLSAKQEGGTNLVAVDRFELTSPTARVRLKANVDMSASPTKVALAEPGEITVGNCKRAGAGALVYVNPFLREMAGGGGNAGSVTLSLQAAQVAVGKDWRKTFAVGGKVAAKNVTLARVDEMSAAHVLPDNVASQLALLTGDTQKTVTLDGETPFTVADGSVVIPGGAVSKIGDVELAIEGTTEVTSGQVKMTAAIVKAPSVTSLFQAASPAAAVAIPIGGTVHKPQLGVLNLKGDLPEASQKSLGERVAAQVAKMRAKETQRLMDKSQRTVQEILTPLKDPGQK